MIVPNEVVAHIIGKGESFTLHPFHIERVGTIFLIFKRLHLLTKKIATQNLGGVLIKELSTIACCQRIDIQQEIEMNRMTNGFYGRSVIISGDFSKRLHVVYLLLRQVCLSLLEHDAILRATYRSYFGLVFRLKH